jgi:AGCS family alanine or glycine:cation symporter
MISWCYYGERGWIYLLDHLSGRGLRSVVVFRIVFVFFVFVGAVAKFDSVLGFSDLLILCMAFPNILGSLVLAPELLTRLKDYWGRYTSGKMTAAIETVKLNA